MLHFKDNLDVLEKVILNYLVINDDEYELFNENHDVVDRNKLMRLIRPSFFNDTMKGEVFRQMKAFFSEYNKIPNVDEVWKFINIKNLDISKEEIETLFTINLQRYTPDFLYKYLKSFVLKNNINSTLSNVLSHIKTTEISPDNIDEICDYVRSEISMNMDIDMTDESLGLDIKNPVSHIQPIKDTKSTGFPFLDKILGGGWEPKTLIVFQGRPKVGKSLILANIAVRAALQNNNVGIFTVELGDRKYVKRVGSNLYNVPYTEYSKFIDDKNLEPIRNAIEKTHANRKIGELWIKEYPTGGASVMEVESYFIKMERVLDIKFDIIIVDYINLLKPTNVGATMYERIKHVSEELRKIAQRNRWCVLSATQVKAAYFNSDELYLDSTAESSGLVATVDSLFGITGEPGSPRLKLKNLANRDEGYMNSHKYYRKIKEFFRIVEDNTPGSEHWTDDDGDEMVKKQESDYRSRNHTPEEIAELEKQEETSKQIPDLKPNKDFDKEETKHGDNLEKSDIEVTEINVVNDNIDFSKTHDDILNS